MKNLFSFILIGIYGLISAQNLTVFFEDADNFERIKNAYAIVETNNNDFLYKVNENGIIKVENINGKIKLWLYAPGYNGYTTHFEISNDLEVKAILSNPKHKLPTAKKNDRVLIDGKILDKYTGKPVKAEIIFNPLDLSLKSNNGKFVLNKNQIKDYKKFKEGDLISFEVKARNYKLYSEVFKFSKSREYKAIFLEPLFASEIKNSETIDNKNLIEKIKNEIKKINFNKVSTGCSNFPSTIRVGLNCNCNSCTSVATMTIYDYVRKGINDEWIGSWHIESLKAGTLPYKSYGAYYVLHPINPNYDISNTTCKQVWDSDICSNCTTAADATQGIFMVTPSDNIARTEYSAENNGLNAPSGEGCGDGYSGTGSSWPCISDNVCTGHDRFGHGRGMCQWGSQRWANNQFKNYEWITDHYYNPGYMYRCNTSHPHPDLTGTDENIDVSSIAPGYTINTTIKVQNISSVYSDRTRIGYYLSTDNTLDANDTFLGYVYINKLDGFAEQNISKTLTIPVTTPDGNYQVLFVEDYQNLLTEVNETNNVQSVALTVDSTNSITTNFITEHITILPVPAKNYVELIYQNIQLEKVELFNLLGQKIRNYPANVTRINLSGLSSGAYLLKITDDEQHTGVFKILKK